jgi:uncharacterized protein
MVFLIWAVRVLVVLLVLRYVVALFGRAAVAPRRSGRTRTPERAGGTLVRDPNCGTYVPESRAVTVSHGGSTLHFCSAACRDAWTLAHPK